MQGVEKDAERGFLFGERATGACVRQEIAFAGQFCVSLERMREASEVSFVSWDRVEDPWPS